MNRYLVLVLGILLIYLAATGRLIRFIDVLRQTPNAPQSGGGGTSGAG